jgi:hypothetical protein
MAALGYKDVGGLDITVDNAFRVSRVERIGDLDRQPNSTSVSTGLPAMRCFRVTPSRNSIAMKAFPS